MKKTLTLLMVSLFFVFVACSDDHQEEDNNNQKEKIELKGYPDSEGKMSFTVSAKSLTIDWGDGAVEKHTQAADSVMFTHQYSSQEVQQILVRGESISRFSVNEVGEYSEIRIGDCPYLKEAFCSKRKLTLLEIEKAESLENLTCWDGMLISLDLSGCVNLKQLNCVNNKLIFLNVKDCKSLTSLNCSANKLSSLDLSGLLWLEQIQCFQNKLTSLDVSGLTKLSYLSCGDNELSALNIKDCKDLAVIYCMGNPLDSGAMCTLIEDLPNREQGDGVIAYYEYSGVCEDIAINKGWSIW